MNRTEKEQLVSELAQKLRNASALYFTDFTGLNVKRMTDLRRRLRKSGVEYVVIKNTLALRAVNQSGLVSEPLRGPTGLVLARDPVTAAKMPSREQMLAELGAGLQSPMAAFVGALNGLLYMFAGALEALRTQREGAAA